MQRIKLIRTTTHLVLGLVAAFTLALSLATPAGATPSDSTAVGKTTVQSARAAGCSGSLIKHLPIRNGAGATLAWLDIYWNGYTKHNCAKTVHSNVTWGHKVYTNVDLFRCKQVDPGTGCTAVAHVDNHGPFIEYAGPVDLWTGSHCIYAYGSIYWNGRYWGRSFQGACS